jgi:hypothetical protein
MAEAETALRRVERLDRARCRAAFEARFTAERMAEQYVEAYRRAIFAIRPRHSAAAS